MIKEISKKAIISKEVKHQNIGGKEIKLEKETTLDYMLDRNFKEINIAEYNFIMRRTELFMENTDEECSKIKIYYGHVGNLGYWVCEDEIKEI